MKYSRELLEPVAKECVNFAEVVRALGMKPHGQTIEYVKKNLIKYGVDISHFTGRARKATGKSAKKLTPDRVLVKNRLNRREHVAIVRRALLEIGRPHQCEECGQGNVWNGRSLVLQVDHKDGDWANNTQENLRFICPNCHTQTDNFGSKNRAGFGAQDAVCSSVANDTTDDDTCEIKSSEPKRKPLTKDRLCGKACERCSKVFIGEKIRMENRRFCSLICRAESLGVKYPPAEQLAELLEELPATTVAVQIGVTSTALKRHCKKINVDTKPRGYWTPKVA